MQDVGRKPGRPLSEAVRDGDRDIRLADLEPDVEDETALVNLAQAHYLRAIAIELRGIREALEGKG